MTGNERKHIATATAGAVLGMGVFWVLGMVGASDPEAAVVTVLVGLGFGFAVAMTEVP